jgi:hypothetical protein
MMDTVSQASSTGAKSPASANTADVNFTQMLNTVSRSDQEFATAALHEITHVAYGGSATEALSFLKLRSLVSDEFRQKFSVQRVLASSGCYEDSFSIGNTLCFKINHPNGVGQECTGTMALAQNPVALLFCQVENSVKTLGSGSTYRSYCPEDGLRGDDALYDEVALALLYTERPGTRAELKQLLVQTINSCLNQPPQSWEVNATNQQPLERKNGYRDYPRDYKTVSFVHWQQTTIPLLLNRFDHLPNQCVIL